MKILVTGTLGYIGSLLAPILIQQGHEVIGVDTGFYQVGCLYNSTKLSAKTLNKDIRHLKAEDFQAVEAVVHPAESNHPAKQLSPNVTYDINHKGSVAIASAAKAAGVHRVYTSSCSVYGVGTDDYVTEESSVNPQTAHADCNTLVEPDVKLLANDSFSPTFLRNATAFGASPRMRFDIVLNNLAGYSWTTKEILMTSDGTAWRPLVHVLDICKATICTLEAPRDIIHNQIFNLGDTASNYQVKEIAQIVAEVFTECQLCGTNGADNRSYRVSFEKINTILLGFKCEWNAIKGVQQLFNIFTSIDMSANFLFRGFTRLKQLEYLIRTG